MNSQSTVMAGHGSHKFTAGHTALGPKLPQHLQLAASRARQVLVSGGHMVPYASSGRPGGAKSPQRIFSVVQSAMKFPGLASALHLIGMNGPVGGMASTDSTVAAAGLLGTNRGDMPPAPEEPPTTLPINGGPLIPKQQSQQQNCPADDTGSVVDPIEAAAAAARATSTPSASTAPDLVYELAAAPTSESNGNGHMPQRQASGEQFSAQAQGVRQVNGHANSAMHRHVVTGEQLSITDTGPRTENNIMPYPGSLPSLAVQIREIAVTLRHINTLRLEYIEKIEQQELELAAKDQVLRSREERIQSLEKEAAEMRMSLALLHSAKVAAEDEIQRLRAAASAEAKLPSVPNAESASAPLPPSPPPPVMDVVATTAPLPEVTTASAKSPLSMHTLTSLPAALAASAPAAVSDCAHAASSPAVTPIPTPAPPLTPTPPPPPRAPEVALLYRSSWPEAFLHCNVEGQGWTALPGLRMEHAGSKAYSIRVQGRSLEFVLTNGHGEWDAPGGGGIGRNYRVDTPGEYRLHYGVLTQVKPWQP